MSLSRKIALGALAVVGAGTIGYGVAYATSPAKPNGPAAAGAAVPAGGVAPHAVAASATPESVYVPLKDCRIVNTSVAGGKIPNGGTRSFYVVGTAGFPAQGGQSGGCGVPASATAISARVSSVSATRNGSFAVYPTGTPDGYGTLYYAKGVNVTTGATLQLGPGTGKVLTARNTLGPAHLVINVNGYYAPQMAAFVQGDGTLTYTTGRVLSTVHNSTGNYQVNFDRDVSTCHFQVTPYAFNWPVAVGPTFGHPNSATVYIHEQVGATTPHDTSFFIQAVC